MNLDRESAAMDKRLKMLKEKVERMKKMPKQG